MRIRSIGYYSQLAKKLYELALLYEACTRQEPPDKGTQATILNEIDALASNHFHLFSAMYKA